MYGYCGKYEMKLVIRLTSRILLFVLIQKLSRAMLYALSFIKIEIISLQR